MNNAKMIIILVSHPFPHMGRRQWENPYHDKFKNINIFFFNRIRYFI